jgi:hypothetical protein
MTILAILAAVAVLVSLILRDLRRNPGRDWHAEDFGPVDLSDGAVDAIFNLMLRNEDNLSGGQS